MWHWSQRLFKQFYFSKFFSRENYIDISCLGINGLFEAFASSVIMVRGWCLGKWWLTKFCLGQKENFLANYACLQSVWKTPPRQLLPLTWKSRSANAAFWDTANKNEKRYFKHLENRKVPELQNRTLDMLVRLSTYHYDKNS